jgi:hypothetical protein
VTTSWKPSPVWSGETVAVFAPGARLTAEIAESLRGHRTIAVNFAARLAPWADMLVALDLGEPEMSELEGFAGMTVCAHEKEGLNALCIGQRCEAVRMPDNRLTIILNSGLEAVRIAYEMGAARIILAGFEPERLRHFYDDEVDTGDYIGVAAGLAAIVKETRERGVPVEFDPRCSLEPGLSTAQPPGDPSIA